MAMISVTDLFYGKRESVQILKDEDRAILEIIHRYNYFYTEPSPSLSDMESDLTTEDSEEESDDLESNWQDVEESSRESSVQDADGSSNEKSRVSKATTQLEDDKEAKVILKVPMCCPECEETVTIALKNVAGNQPTTVGYSSSFPSDNYRCLFIIAGIISVVGILVVVTATGLHSV